MWNVKRLKIEEFELPAGMLLLFVIPNDVQDPDPFSDVFEFHKWGGRFVMGGRAPGAPPPYYNQMAQL